MKKKRIGILAVILVGLIMCSLSVSAKAKVDVQAEGSIRIRYEIAGVNFSIYKVAEVSEEYRFLVTEDFDRYQIDFDNLNSEEWRTLAETLTGYAVRDKIPPLKIGRTDEKGILVFENLSPGVYLVVGEQADKDSYVYCCRPFLAFVPEEQLDGTWNYHTECIPKTDKIPVDLMDYTVIKKWKDEGKEDIRPKEILVQLMKDGEPYEEVLLNEENNWLYTWKELSSDYTWKVVEKEVPEGYTVEITQTGTVFEIINSTDEEPEIPEKLPQTGQYWWPIPILAMFGLLFLLLGVIRRKDII